MVLFCIVVLQGVEKKREKEKRSTSVKDERYVCSRASRWDPDRISDDRRTDDGSEFRAEPGEACVRARACAYVCVYEESYVYTRLKDSP